MKILLAAGVGTGQGGKAVSDFFFQKTKLEKLYSFLHEKKMITDWIGNWENHNKMLMVDSGAFSWNKSGDWKVINKGQNLSGNLPKIETHLHNYLEFVKKYSAISKAKNKKLIFVEFDVYGILPKEEVDKTYREVMSTQKDVNFIRVYHPDILDGGDFSVLKKWFDEGQTYIGLGSSSRKYFKQIFALTKEKVKYHFFAGTNVKTLLEYPFYSADSTTWRHSVISGTLYFYRNFMQIKNVFYRDPKIADFLVPFLIEAEKQELNRIQAQIQNIEFTNFVQELITNLWKERGIEWND